MPFPFILPTTSAFSFSSSFSSDTHPSLPLSSSTYRGVVRDALKKHKRLPPASQSSHVSTVVGALNGYIPYILAIDAGLNPATQSGDYINLNTKAPPSIEWRPTLSDNAVPGREQSRVKIQHVEHEIFFTLSTLANSYTLIARAALHPLYVATQAALDNQQRTAAIQTATKYLLDAASIYDYIASRAERAQVEPPCSDVSPSTLRAMSSLALAEATMLAVLKDDPYPAIIAQDRNKNDREWMYKAPEIPKVRAHLFARLCLAAAEHASQASSLCQAAGRGSSKVNEGILRYLEDLRRTCRAKACRFFGIDAEIGGQVGTAIAWLQAGLQELGVESKYSNKSSGFGRFKKEWSEKREERKVEKGTTWGADGGKGEETRVIEFLEGKWHKLNDTMNVQTIPPIGPLLAQMPSGRAMHTLKPYQPPILDRSILEAMRAPPERSDDYGDSLSSEDEAKGHSGPPGGYPESRPEYRSGSTSYY
ncbi:pH-response regulator protein palC [Colletotrichum graminicola]|uniref:pH-response regulator protein palC n=1 Tax=Colletotrichum graminicola (strain M1.001 / M2 / FGSC 10212) TaxID=645133 RepID=E3QWL2_COLGM|nr:pH-response regulator protein palC [Colletotrichum graminicola M1.001]EFQ35250.1 pH-response regulator protein palC [Colletotrichum graminicola M1.001]WDK14478.1 pH-response regulator protein palC [Colletotrichum graminicola]